MYFDLFHSKGFCLSAVATGGGGEGLPYPHSLRTHPLNGARDAHTFRPTGDCWTPVCDTRTVGRVVNAEVWPGKTEFLYGRVSNQSRRAAKHS